MPSPKKKISRHLFSQVSKVALKKNIANDHFFPKDFVEQIIMEISKNARIGPPRQNYVLLRQKRRPDWQFVFVGRPWDGPKDR